MYPVNIQQRHFSLFLNFTSNSKEFLGSEGNYTAKL